MFIYLLALVVILSMAYYKRFCYRRRRKGEPPIVPGHMIWGNGEQFKNDAIKFLHDSQKNHGDIFTIRFFHQRLTIIADPHSVEAMSREKCFDFDPIQKQVNMNVFSFVLVNARKMIKEAGKRVRGSHLVTEMRRYAVHLDEAFNKVSQGNNNKNNGCIKNDEDSNNNTDKSNALVNNNNNNNDAKSHCQETDGLRKFVSKTNFAAMFYTIFGRSDDQVFEPQTVYHCFDVFHRYFNYLWLGLPIKLFPKAIEALTVLCKQPSSKKILAREDLSDYIRYSTEFMLAHGQSEQDIMGHNLVYLHVNYNTFRLSFWNMYFLLSHREAYDALKNEVSGMIRKKMESRASDETGPVVFSIKEIEEMPVLDSINSETLRLCSGVFMVRYVNEDCNFKMNNGQTFLVRKGDRVAVYPPAIHKDPEIFEDPMDYKYDRFVDQKFYKNGKQLKNPIMTFGTLCPGKRYAILQAKWYLVSQINKFEMYICNGQTAELDISYHGHEILPPVKDIDIQFRCRENYQEITMH
ncbi:prostacyclin synthase-like isoform X1 [Octopus sinensis]|uniref:Prostacyclin synthase-like isoform X1 n=1 Tax=Octopus sinensis TaxID=2607531 RepID=A0A6P7TX41_9MOLL|nr:prostacyclin synthase-like isoform X1 [Octopus sinensis]